MKLALKKTKQKLCSINKKIATLVTIFLNTLILKYLYDEIDNKAWTFLFHQINMRLTVSCVKISSASYSISVQSTDSF